MKGVRVPHRETTVDSAFHRISRMEIPLCLAFNRINHRRTVSRLFGVISRLGDGYFWYGLMLLLPVFHGGVAWQAVGHMLGAGIVCLLIYRVIKQSTGRTRPFELHSAIFQNIPPLDKYSFPSGHTLHAVAFTVVLVHYYPQWAIVAIPFTLLVALSRLILGLHFPTDVVAGAAIGATVATLSLYLVHWGGF